MNTAKRALVTPSADFWLLGGLSLLIPVSLGLLFPGWAAPRVSPAAVAGWTFYAPLLISAPHFAFSYQLFYKGLPRRLADAAFSRAGRLRMLVAGFIAPAAMAVWFAAAMAWHSMPMLSAAANAMLLLSVWHYARQGYGALITGSVYRGIFYGPQQKFILNANAYLMPAYAWIMFNSTTHATMYRDVPYGDLGLPLWPARVLLLPVAIFALLSAAVFLRKWLIDRRGIPVNGVLGYACGTYLWLALYRVSPNFFFLVPLFHALQYMPFVYKFKKSETAGAGGAQARAMVLFALTGLALGVVFMWYLPHALDALALRFGGGARIGWTHDFFLVSFVVFINIHHFFIDYAFWRRDNRDVETFLFRA